MPKLRQSGLVAASDADGVAAADDPQCSMTSKSTPPNDENKDVPSSTGTSTGTGSSTSRPPFEDRSNPFHDEVCSEIDSDEYSDDSDDSDYNDDNDEEEEDSESYEEDDDFEDEDDDEDNDWQCDCPNCVYRRLYGYTNDMEEEDDDEEYFYSGCGTRRSREEGEDDHEDEDDHEYDGPSCAVCFGQPTLFNPLVDLPCCGSNGREARSSTRFCQKCMSRTLQSQNASMYYDYPPWSHVGECPRCRQIISMDTQDMTISTATFRQAIRHARHKEKAMRDILITAAYANPHFLPIELMANEVDKVRQMCSWGILKEKKKGLYTIDPEDQVTLRSYIEINVMDEDSMPGRCQTAGDLLFAGLLAALKLKLFTSARLFNQCGINMLMHFFNFPTLDHPFQEFAMVGLNIFLTAMILQVALFMALYGVICYFAIKSMAWFIRFQKRSWSRLKAQYPKACKTVRSFPAAMMILPYIKLAFCGVTTGVVVGVILVKCGYGF